MAESIVSDLAGKLLGYIGKQAFERIASYFGGTSELKKLEETMEMIQARLIDAEKRQEEEDGAAINVWLRRLKRVLYKLEDLFEEVEMADRDTNQVPCLAFDFRRLKLNKKVSQEVKVIMGDLDRIKSDMAFLDLRVLHPVEHQHAFSERETYSYISEKDVIGREIDRIRVVRMLLDSEQEGVYVIPIVGMGGLGKTTLAQLCFNDISVKQCFELKGWTCISVILSLKEVLMKILHCLNGDDCDKLSIEELQTRLRRVVKNSRYLLVMDDVWDENEEIWLNLKSIFSNSKRGSRIIVTTRSIKVAEIMGKDGIHRLEGLSDDESWDLFKRLAFRPEDENSNLESIGKKIIKKCVNVPLAIRTIARLLYYRYTEKDWVYFMDSELSAIEQNYQSTKIMSTLKLSYDYLSSPLSDALPIVVFSPRIMNWTRIH